MIGAEVRLRAAPKPGVPLAVPVPAGSAPGNLAGLTAGFSGAAGEVRDAATADGRRLLLGAGRPRLGTDWEALGASAVRAAGPAKRLGLDARGLPPDAAVALATGAALAAWHPHEAPLRRLDLVVDQPAAVQVPWARAEAAVQGALFTRELTALPGNVLHPSAFAARLEALAEHGIGVDVLSRKRLQRMGAGALLAVGAGAKHGPRLAVLRWRGQFAVPPVAFVGKGITFDTGGISIKPAEGMERMTSDMAGAAACAGAMLAMALRNSPAPAVAVLAIAENTTGAGSYRPGDVLATLSGRTVEVVDTDAEGRLVLADALHYAASRFKPQAMLDLATLTGAMVTALGGHRAGIFTNNAALQAQAAAAGDQVGEALWPMPIGARHRADLDSQIADLKQCCSGPLLPDASHAAAFLREFAGDTPWVHLDIAGVRLDDKGLPTGFGARLLDRLVELYFEHPDRH